MVKRRTLALVATVVAVATSAACGSDDSSGVAEGDGWGKLGPAELIEDAEEAGATSEQIAILEKAQETGEISFEEYSAAIDRGLRCIREMGGDTYDHGTSENQGILERSYSIGEETLEANSVEFWPGITVHRCIAKHTFAVKFAYENQPSSQEVKEAFWEERRDALVDCLHEQGLDEVVGDEPMSELKRIATEAVHEGSVDQNCATEVASDNGEAES